MPVAISATELGSGTVLVSGADGAVSSVGPLAAGGLPSGAGSDGGLSPVVGSDGGFVAAVAVVVSDPVVGGAGVPLSGDVPAVFGLDEPLGVELPLGLGSGVVRVCVPVSWNVKPGWEDPLWEECANAMKRPAPRAAPVPAIHSPRWPFEEPLSAGLPTWAETILMGATIRVALAMSLAIFIFHLKELGVKERTGTNQCPFMASAGPAASGLFFKDRCRNTVKIRLERPNYG